MKAAKTVAIPLTLEELALIGDALNAYADALQYSMALSFRHLSSKQRRSLDDVRVNAQMFKGELYRRLKVAAPQAQAPE